MLLSPGNSLPKDTVDRVPQLDGLRGLAICMVIVWHYLVLPCRPLLTLMNGSLTLLRSGVDLFFVLSGFLIGSILLRGERTRLPMAAFYWRRAYRILPLYYVWMLGFSVLSAFIAAPLFTDRTSPLVYLLVAQNWAYAVDNGFGSDWLAVTWSLCVEEQFYIVLPLLVRFLPLRVLTVLLCSTLVICPALRWWLVNNNQEMSAYVLLPARADTLAMGVLLAIAFKRDNVRRWITDRTSMAGVVGLFCMLTAAILVTRTPIREWSIEYSAIGVAYAALVAVVAGSPSRWLMDVLMSAPLQRAGILAYGLYIFHQGINHWVYWTVEGSGPAIRGLRGFALMAFSLVLVYGVASVSWKYFESPVLEYGRLRHPYRPSSSREISAQSVCASRKVRSD